VQCAGKCEGNCKGAAQGGTGTGIKADGTCDGTCEGTCQVTAPGVTCTGSCKGECKGSCSGTAEASVKCDGECKADYEPLKCEGGKLEGGCQVDAKCDANCDASISAKAECTPPAVNVTFSGAASLEAAAKLKGVFEANLGVVLALEARLKGMVDLTGTITGNASAVASIKAACIPAVVASAATGVEDITASVSATGNILAATK
jgi:modification target Cys-rich repeat protein